MRVTSGRVIVRSTWMEIDEPTTRVTFDQSYVDATFTYLGFTAYVVPLGSGEVRSQFGVKVLERDPCNLVYVMVRAFPEPLLVVQLKSNPGQTSKQCGNAGYSTLAEWPLEPVEIGATVHLRVRGTADCLDIYCRGVNYEVCLPAASDQGPYSAGVRTDNARVIFELA